MKKTILIFTLLVCSFALRAQDYNWGVGIRGGGTFTGIDVRYNFNPTHSIEALVAFTNGVNLVGLFEWNVPVIAEGFNFYYGAGANIGAWKSHGVSDFCLGIDAILGLEYKIPRAPIALAVDYKPFLNLVSKTRFEALDFGLSVKYTF